MRILALAGLALATAACGGARERGTATLWVTRDRGARVVYSGVVPAGISAMQALARRQAITTRYGGRFVQSIGGVEGSLSRRRDWFYFVNGREGDRSATEVKLRDGDVEWWDYRSWAGGAMSVPVVAGAYPQPFVGAATSVVATGVAGGVARRIAAQVHGVVASRRPTVNYILLSDRLPPEAVRIKRFRRGVVLQLGARVARRLAADPSVLRYRYGAAA